MFNLVGIWEHSELFSFLAVLLRHQSHYPVLQRKEKTSSQAGCKQGATAHPEVGGDLRVQGAWGNKVVPLQLIILEESQNQSA